MKLSKQNALELALRMSVLGAILYFTTLLAFYLGVEEKSFFQKHWDILTGGGLGWVFGIGAFIVVGTVGWVAGPLYGAVGLITMATGGFLGGLGLGSIVHMLRNPSDYNYNLLVLGLVLVSGILLGWFLARFLARWGSGFLQRKWQERISEQGGAGNA